MCGLSALPDSKEPNFRTSWVSNSSFSFFQNVKLNMTVLYWRWRNCISSYMELLCFSFRWHLQNKSKFYRSIWRPRNDYSGLFWHWFGFSKRQSPYQKLSKSVSTKCPNKFWTLNYCKKICHERLKNSRKFVYILLKQCRCPFNLTIFFLTKISKNFLWDFHSNLLGHPA